MNWCLASGHSEQHLPVRELSLANHVRYASKHSMDVHMLVKPWDSDARYGIENLLLLLDRYDAIMGLGADVIITNPEKSPDSFYDPAYGMVVSAEDIGGCPINNDTMLVYGKAGRFVLSRMMLDRDRLVSTKWLTQGMLAEVMKECFCGKWVKVLPQTELQSLPDWEYPDKACCWKPGHFCCHFLMENKAERMKRFLTEHPEFA